MYRLLITLFSLLTLTVPAMAAPPQKPIINGATDYNNPEHYAVVLIQMEAGGAPLGMCSGTLISPDTILTASHCVEGISGATVYFFEGNSYGYVDAINAADWHTAPNWDSNALTGDIAIIKLQRDAPAEITPILPLPPSMAITDNDLNSTVVTFVGYGLADPNNDNSAGTRRTAQAYIKGQCSTSGGCTLYAQPLGGYMRFQEGILLFYQEDLQGNWSGTCSGDSGGPAFITRNGITYVAGVTSYGDSEQCDGIGVDTKVDYYYDFIATYTDNLSYEVCDNGRDDDGDGRSDCDDPDCSSNDVCIPTACEDARVLSCGQSLSGDTSNGVTKFDMHGNGCISSYERGPEQGYVITPPAGQNVTITLHAQNSNSDLDMFLLSSSCNQTQCMDNSMLDPGHDETITFTGDGNSYYVIVETYENAGPYTISMSCGGSVAENCTNGADDDGDGKADCNDPDCAGTSACGGTAENCVNGVDDDGDGKADCMDPDCASSAACSAVEDCSNNVDDDHDGMTDCQDADCYSSALCSSAVENCSDGVDNDGDGFADCSDVDCASSGLCAQQPPENCADSVDNDGDGNVDCDDPDCNSSALCAGTFENCSDGADNDGDGFADCQDADCQSSRLCMTTQTYPEICYDGVDNDGDGKTDCRDPDCASFSRCTGMVSVDDNEPPSVFSCRTTGNMPFPAPLGLGILLALVLARRSRRR